MTGFDRKPREPSARLKPEHAPRSEPAASFGLPRFLRQSGQPLPHSLRDDLESRFGESFADVRVHADAQAAAATHAAGAAALAHGTDICIAPGRFRPGTRAGDALIAHELAHVVQRRRADGGSRVEAERDADRVERAFAAGERSLAVRNGAPRGMVLAKPVTPQEIEIKASSAHGGTPMTQALSEFDMKRIYPALGAQQPAIVTRYTTLTNRTFAVFKMDTVESRAFFLAQAYMESGQFAHMVEGDLESPYAEQVEGGADRTPFYTPTQLAEFRKRYAKNKKINPGKDRLPKSFSGPKTDENFAYVGRGPVQVTGRTNYENSASTLEHWGLEYEKNGDPPGIKASDLPGTGDTVAARLKSAAKAIRDDPALAGDPDYAFLLSGAFMKMGWMGSPTATNATSLDAMASRTPGAMSAADMYGKSGLMHGKAGVKWGSKEFDQAWGKDAQLVKDNFETKAREYNRIRDVLREVAGVKTN